MGAKASAIARLVQRPSCRLRCLMDVHCSTSTPPLRSRQTGLSELPSWSYALVRFALSRRDLDLEYGVDHPRLAERQRIVTQVLVGNGVYLLGQ